MTQKYWCFFKCLNELFCYWYVWEMCVCSSRRIQIRDNDIRAIHLMSKLTRAFLPSFSSLPQRGGITNQKPISDSSSSSSLLSFCAATNVSIWSLLFYLALSSVTVQHFYERNTSVLTCPLGRVINMATAAAIFSNSFFLFRNLSGVWPCGVQKCHCRLFAAIFILPLFPRISRAVSASPTLIPLLLEQVIKARA